MEGYMYQPKYDYRDALQDLRNHGIDIEEFKKRLEKISGGTVYNQAMFDFLYLTIVVNNYKLH